MTSNSSTTLRFFTVDDVAAAMAVSSKTVRRWIEQGDLHVHRVGRLVRVSDDDFRTFSAARRK
jgi:excisionase family DNA binding protein